MAPTKRRKTTLATVISVPFVILIISSVTLVGYFSYRSGLEVSYEAAAEVRRMTYSRVLEHLTSFLSAPRKINQANAGSIRLQDLNIENPRSLQNHFWQQLQVFRKVSYIHFSNTMGGISLVARRADGSFVARQTEGFNAGRYNMYQLTPEGERGEAIKTGDSFDARVRPWYKKALNAKKPAWSDIYPFVTDKALGITAVHPVTSQDGQLQGVLATDILLSHIHDYLHELKKESQIGEVFIFEPSGLLVASSSTEKPYRNADNNPSLKRIHATDSTSPLIRTAYLQLSEQLGDLSQITASRQLTFDFNGEQHSLQLSPFRDSMGLNWVIAISVPEAQFATQLEESAQITVALCLVTLVISILLSLHLAKRVSRPVTDLEKAVYSLYKGNWNQTVSAGKIEEIDALARMFNTMLHHLRKLFGEINDRNEKLEATRVALNQANRALKQRVKSTSSELTESEERYRRLSEVAFEGIIIHSNGRIIDGNKAVEEILGYSLKAIIGQNLQDFVEPEYQDFVTKKIAACSTEPFELVALNKQNEKLILEVRATETPLQGKQVGVFIIRDITKRKQAEERLHMLATTDPLTKACNRRHFQELAEDELRKSQRFDHPLTLMLLDIDFFKDINDSYGHTVGDEVIQAIMPVCQDQLRDVDIIGRFGGDEFSIIMPETNSEGATLVAERLRASLADIAIFHENQIINISVSIGIASLDRETIHYTELVKQADKALYKAKAKGRNCCVVYTPPGQQPD